MPRKQFHTVTVTDFSSGVVHPGESIGKSTHSQPGTLVEAVGCVATATGALGPGWRPLHTVSSPLPYNDWFGPDDRPAAQRMVLHDAVGWTDVYDTYSVFVAGGDQTPDVHTFAPAVFRFYTEPQGSPGDFRTHFFHPNGVLSLSGGASPISDRNVRAMGGFFSLGRSQSFTASAGTWTTPVFPVVVLSRIDRINSYPDRLVYPNLDTAANVPSTRSSAIGWNEVPTGAFWGVGATFHQEKFVWAEYGDTGFGLTSSTVPYHFKDLLWMQRISYTARLQGGYRDITFPAPFHTSTQLAVGESTEHIAWMVSINANSLLIMTRTSGAYLIRGDMDYAQIVKLAGAPLCISPFSMPCVIPQGIFFTTREGAFIITENGEITNVSPQLPSGCFDPSAPGLASASNESMGDYVIPWSPVGRCHYRQPYVLCPNSWMYDTRNKSWWQLPPPPVYSTNDPTYDAYITTGDGTVYALPWFKQEHSHEVDWCELDPGAATSGSWFATTHILTEALPPHSATMVRELEAVLSGTGTVTFTVSNPTESATVTFTADGNTQRFRGDVSVDSATARTPGRSPGARGTFVHIRAEGNGTDPAPTVHEITLNLDVGRTVGAT